MCAFPYLSFKPLEALTHEVRIVDVLRQAGVSMEDVKKWIAKRRMDDPEPAWIRLVEHSKRIQIQTIGFISLT